MVPIAVSLGLVLQVDAIQDRSQDKCLLIVFQGLALKSNGILVDHICNDIAAFIGKFYCELKSNFPNNPYVRLLVACFVGLS